MTTRDTIKHRKRFIESLIPTSVYRRGFIRQVSAASGLHGVTFRIASTFDEREQAYRILHDAYVGRGIAAPHPSGLRFSPFNVMPGTATMVAVRDGRVIGTVSLVEDTPLGIPMEKTHPEEIAAVRATGRRFAEVGTLAVTPEGRGRLVSLQLYNTMYRWARRHRGIDDLVIAVHPRINKFFKDVLMFEQLGRVRAYRDLHSAKSTPLRLDLTTVGERYRPIYNRRSMAINLNGVTTDLYRFFIGDPTVPAVEVASAPAWSATSHNPSWTESDVRRLMHRCGVAVTSLEREDHSAISSFYPGLQVA